MEKEMENLCNKKLAMDRIGPDADFDLYSNEINSIPALIGIDLVILLSLSQMVIICFFAE